MTRAQPKPEPPDFTGVETKQLVARRNALFRELERNRGEHERMATEVAVISTELRKRERSEYEAWRAKK